MYVKQAGFFFIHPPFFQQRLLIIFLPKHRNAKFSVFLIAEIIWKAATSEHSIWARAEGCQGDRGRGWVGWGLDSPGLCSSDKHSYTSVASKYKHSAVELYCVSETKTATWNKSTFSSWQEVLWGFFWSIRCRIQYLPNTMTRTCALWIRMQGQCYFLLYVRVILFEIYSVSYKGHSDTSKKKNKKTWRQFSTIKSKPQIQKEN